MTTIIKSPEVQQLRLANDLFPLFHGRVKKVTFRKGRRDIKLGSLAFVSTDPVDPDDLEWDIFTSMYDDKLQSHFYMLQFVKVMRVEYMLAGDISEQAAQDDGFSSAELLIKGMRRFYPDFDADTEVTYIRFFAR